MDAAAGTDSADSSAASTFTANQRWPTAKYTAPVNT
jgi:hypothetical protein